MSRVEARNALNPHTISKIEFAAQTLIDQTGIEGIDTQTASLSLSHTELTHAPTGTEPQIKINKPIGEFADEARWAYEITYGMQHQSASRHILVLKDGAAEMAFYSSMPDRALSEQEASIMAEDLDRLAEPAAA